MDRNIQINFESDRNILEIFDRSFRIFLSERYPVHHIHTLAFRPTFQRKSNRFILSLLKKKHLRTFQVFLFQNDLS